ncbi:dihydrofolate reductase [Terrimicrobium sacchariphilum]|uniref:Dihydrofolate reductase n=1 Tax=Terrimicrobium sacchariphilum TaxID=690879 RepID=A0A146GGM2_TERSA|nr:dihydrofolate reductase [Terrimicrobium sacchariphilum]
MKSAGNKDILRGHVFIATSLDGFIARRDGDIGWLEEKSISAARLDGENEDHGYADFLAGMDGIIMGRRTFEKVLTFDSWPFDKPVVVLSRFISAVDLPSDIAGRVTILNQPPRAVAEYLAGRGWEHAYIDGGQVIQAFLREGLIADLVITRIPILLGDGLPLFGAIEDHTELRHLGTKAFPSGFVQSRYKVLG